MPLEYAFGETNYPKKWCCLEGFCFVAAINFVALAIFVSTPTHAFHDPMSESRPDRIQRGFDYIIPEAINTVEGLYSHLLERRIEADRRFDEAFEEAAGGIGHGGIFDPGRFTMRNRWQLFGSSDRILSLGLSSEEFFGTRSIRSFEALMWDREADRMINWEDILTDSQAFFQTLAPSACSTFRAMQFERDLQSMDCPDFETDFAKIPAMSYGNRFSHIDLLIDGPLAGYAWDASYQITVWLPPESIEYVREEYRSQFVAANYQEVPNR